MDELIRKQLEQEQPTEFHEALLKHCKNLVELSARKMSDYYDGWNQADTTYRGQSEPDKADKAAAQRKEPTKMVVPLTYAQVQTFVAFCMSLFLQRERVFELVGQGESDDKGAKVGEALIARDLTYNVFETRLYQFLIDVSRFGLGILKTGWIRKTGTELTTTLAPPPMMNGIPIGQPQQITSEQEVTRFLGNLIYNVSPFRFFPDPRLPLSRFQEGEFCASDETYSLIYLRELERDGEVAGIQWVKPLTQSDLATRFANYGMGDLAPMADRALELRAEQSAGTAILTECQISLIPSNFKIDGKPMGPETTPVKWNVWFVNNKRIVKAEPLGYVHNMFTYDVAEFSPDFHKFINNGLAGTIDELQSVITWFINSHITSVRKTIQNHIVVDPTGIEMKDLVERRPVIRMHQDKGGQGIDRFIKQLDVVDTTAHHVQDAQEMQSWVEVVTGINANALGQFHTGRRSATEARNVNSATAARLKLTALLIFRNALEPMARKMLSNLQQGLDEETYIKVLGDPADPEGFVKFKAVTRADLVGKYDFEIFDGTLPSERGQQAEALGEMLMAFMANPQLAMSFGYDPMKMLAEWFELRGIRNPKRFLLDPIRAQVLQQQIQQAAMYEQNRGKPAGAGQPGLFGGQSTQMPIQPVGATIPPSLTQGGPAPMLPFGPTGK